jgi:hypothetical protein
MPSCSASFTCEMNCEKQRRAPRLTPPTTGSASEWNRSKIMRRLRPGGTRPRRSPRPPSDSWFQDRDATFSLGATRSPLPITVTPLSETV